MTALNTTLKPKHIRVCRNCLLPFLGKTVSTMYCASTCKRKYQHKTKYILKGRKKYKTEEERKFARKKAIQKYNKSEKKKIVAKRFRDKPESKTKARLYQTQKRERYNFFARQRNQRPEVKMKRSEYAKRRNKLPEVIEARNIRRRKWRKNLEVRRKAVEYNLKRYREDPVYRARQHARVRFYKKIKQITGSSRTSYSKSKLIGCSLNFFKKYIEYQFKPGMSWDNYGLKTWHIDHIKPLAKFDLTKEDQVKQACHYQNLQPLWAKENLIKNAKYYGE